MFDLDSIRTAIMNLDEADAKSILMLTAANIATAKTSDGRFSSDECIEQLVRLYSTIPKLKEKK